MLSQIKKFDIIPFQTSALKAMLSNYNYPANKISSLLAKGTIIQLKKGLYILSEEYCQSSPSKDIIANHIYGPSYISLDYALSYYSLIPEKVFSVSSITTKRTRKFITPFGTFTYRQADSKYYSIGINIETIHDKYNFFIASPEKAICDKIVFTPYLKITTEKQMQSFLLDDLRIDFSGIELFDFSIIENCIKADIKRKELMVLRKTISSLL
jgi:hypothetical protein